MKGHEHKIKKTGREMNAKSKAMSGNEGQDDIC